MEKRGKKTKIFELFIHTELSLFFLMMVLPPSWLHNKKGDQNEIYRYIHWIYALFHWHNLCVHLFHSIFKMLRACFAILTRWNLCCNVFAFFFYLLQMKSALSSDYKNNFCIVKCFITSFILDMTSKQHNFIQGY